MNTIAKADLFVFAGYEAQWEKGDLFFHYEVEQGGETIEFVEKWHVLQTTHIDNIPPATLNAMLQTLHLLVGISYYKMYCPSTIKIAEYSLSQEQADFWNKLYTKGLGEFFYKNQLDFRDYIHFPYDADGDTVASAQKLAHMEEKALVLHGGGKDSIVSAEIVAESHVPFDLFTLNPQFIHQAVADVMEKPIISITRELDPKVFDLNASGTVYNGHIPISAIYSFAATLIALLQGYTYIIISSERSSDYGNVHYLGEAINHQWSKSQEAEDMIRTYIDTNISPDIAYFSLLRPFYEISVVKKFSKYKKYFESFSSSNHNFKIDQSGNTQRWDYTSPKTLFVFVMLSAFLSKEEMVRIFGENLYDRSDFIEKFRELLGLTDVKPFECVGTPDETIVAMCRAHKAGEYAESPVVDMFSAEIMTKNLNLEILEKEVFSYGDDANIPAVFRSLL